MRASLARWVGLALAGTAAAAAAVGASPSPAQQQQITFGADAPSPQDDIFAPTLGGSFAQADTLRIELPRDAASTASAETQRTVEEELKAHSARDRGAHAVLTHAEFPGVSVRIKQLHEGKRSLTKSTRADGASVLDYDRSDPEAFCDPGVSSWSGYIDLIDGKSLFFYFFESRTDPAKDPVLFWTNGGPGCSSAMGLFQEHGPCRIVEGSSKSFRGPPINGTEYNPYSWNERANTLYVEQPVGVGMSYSRYGVETGNTDAAARDIYAFLRIFYAAFDRFRDSELILSGESYGGRYIPLFASEVVDRNQQYELRAEFDGKKPKREHLLPLTRVAIGNGLTDASRQAPRYYEYLCTRQGGYKPVLSVEQCTRMQVYADRCERELARHCRESYNADKCGEMMGVCQAELMGPYGATGRNPYDITDSCKVGLSPNLCYAVSEDIRAYLDRDDVRALLGAEPVDKIGRYQTCSPRVGALFGWSMDTVLDNSRNVAALLERGVDVLIYVGEADVICNWLGNRAWVDDMQWSARDKFAKHAVRRWTVDGDDAGQAQEGGGLTWATIKGAGHLVPYDEPARALAMLNRWLDGERL